MSGKRKEQRKLRHQRNSNVLARTIKAYNTKSYKLLRRIEQYTDNNYLSNIIQRRNADLISEEFSTLYAELKTILVLTKREYLYYETLSNRLIENLEITISRLKKIKQIIKRSSDKTIKDIDIEKLRSDLKNNILTKFKNNLWLGIKQARDTKHGHETVREGISAFLSEKGIFSKIKKSSKRIRSDIKLERGVKKKIRDLPKEIKSILESKTKNKKEKIIQKLDVLKTEYSLMNDELNYLSTSTTLNIRCYFIIIKIINNLDKLYAIINDSEKHIEAFPEHKLKKIRKHRNKAIDKADEYKKEEFALVKILLKEFKSA